VALGLDQGPNGDAWGYDIGAQRVTLSAAGLGWPHYFVDLSGVGGSADPASDLVIIAACTQLAPRTPVSASPSASPSGSPGATPSGSPSATPSGSPSATPSGSPSATPSGSAGLTAAPTATSPTSPGPSSSASGTPGPDVSPSASPTPVQGCLRPELVALNL
jgi:hypothetical protein